MGKCVKTFCFREHDLVLRLNARKKGRKGDTLSSEWLGPYTIVAITENGQCRLQDANGKELKTKINSCQLKHYHPVQTMATSPIASSKTTEANGFQPVDNLVIEDAPVPDHSLLSPGDCDSLPLEKGKVPVCTVPSAYISHVTPTMPASLSPIKPVFTAHFTHISTSLISDSLIPKSESNDSKTDVSFDPDVQFIGIVASPMPSFNKR